MAYKNSRLRTPETCPVCGEDVPPRALACPECGADHNSGWKEDADETGGLDLPDEEFNYEDFIKEEFGSGAPRSGIKPLWWLVAVILLATLIAGLIFSVF